MSRIFRISEVAGPRSPVYEVTAPGPEQAVALRAGCRWQDVCLPVWSTYRNRYDAAVSRRPASECYMPLDNSGRQWLVSEVERL